MIRLHPMLVAALLLPLALLTGCNRPPANRVQGYVEGEFVYVASPLAGQVITLSVQRGDLVKSGDPLFALDHVAETAARDQADHLLTQALADLEDTKKGKRPSEIASMQAQLEQARAGLAFSEKELARNEGLIKSAAVSRAEYDQSQSNRDQDVQRVAQLEADLKTAALGQRSDQIAAAEAEVKARQAALAQAQWNVSQKQQVAPQAGLVFDTLYRQGEWVDAGHPVVSLLPPANVKVRAFVAEARVGAIHLGDPLKVAIDGVAAPAVGKVSFISPRAEYTPPVIYSEESRGKLVFMIEIVFDASTAAGLHPGQPVDVLLGP